MRIYINDKFLCEIDIDVSSSDIYNALKVDNTVMNNTFVINAINDRNIKYVNFNANIFNIYLS